MATRFSLIAMLSIAIVAIALSWSRGETIESARQTAAAPGADVDAVAAATNQFAFDVYRQLGADGGNFFYSPLSISTAFTMAYDGARGETAEQMAGVFHYPQHEDAVWGNPRLHRATGTLLDRFNDDAAQGDDKRPYQLAIANRMWGDASRPFLPEFLETMREHYDAGMVPVDFAKDAERVRGEINRWVEQKTNRRIRDLMPPGSIDSLTRLVLVNAIYFKGDWAMPFQESATRDLPFTTANGEKIDAKMMHQKARFGYVEGDGFKALEMPYKGGDLSMVVLLPNAADGLAEFEAQLTEANVKQWLSRMKVREVRVRFPRFKLESRFALNQTLSELGMPLAFSDTDADFSGFSGSPDLHISAAIHQAFVEVTERGTEAAAATGIAVATRAAVIDRPAEFHADHPFVFLIRDRHNGAVLFLGRFATPQE